MGLKANNKIVRNKKVASPQGEATPSITPIVLNKTETLILLEALKNSTFKGEMVETVYTLVVKLKSHLNDV